MRGRTGGRGTVLFRNILLITCAAVFMALQSGLAVEEPHYSIQVGAFKEAERARKLVERLTRDGHLSFYREEEIRTKGTWHMVFIGDYPSREEARKQAKELRKKGVISEFLIRETTGTRVSGHSSPEPTLTIEDVEFKVESGDKEVVLIRASRPFSPSVFPLEEGHLRLVIDIADTLSYPKDLTELPVGGIFIEKIRMFYHREKKSLRIVLDLASSKSYKVHQFFFEKENTFAVVVERKNPEVPDGSSRPDGDEKPSYRSEGMDIEPRDLKEMLLKHHFYASCWDHTQDFCNPEGHFENLFVEDKGETISDRASRLMWQKGGSRKPMPWNEARIYVNRLNRENFAGRGDWRLPTTEELGTLIERSWQEGRLFISPLFEAAQTSCWSVDTMGDGRAWVVSFHLGHFSHSPKSFEHFVRAVRSEP